MKSKYLLSVGVALLMLFGALSAFQSGTPYRSMVTAHHQELAASSQDAP